MAEPSNQAAGTGYGARPASPGTQYPASDTAAPKYPDGVTPLSRDQGHLRRAPAPDFWALIPYYAAQRDDVSCSLATITMLANAARRLLPLSADQRLVTQFSLEQQVNSPVWAEGLAPGGDGVTLGELAALVNQSMSALGLPQEVARVIHVVEASPEALTELRAALERNERSGDDWIVLNFRAEEVLGAGEYGHFAPVAAYDVRQRRVLVLDPDRDWFEPYWVSDEAMLRGMATFDTVANRSRGYLYIAPNGAR